MECVKSINLKHNFLKHIIIRLDFQKVPFSNVAEMLNDFKSYFEKEGFNHFEIKKENQAQIDLPKQGQESLGIHGSITSVKDIYSFSNDNNGVNIDFCDNFIVINVNSNKYIPFMDYFKYLNVIIQAYNTMFPFLTLTRLGVRKQNICIVDGDENINKFFSKDIINFYNKLEHTNNLSSTRIETFEIEKYRVNLKSSINKGLFNDKEMYKIVIDIDAYLNDNSLIKSVLSNVEEAKKMNFIIFNAYISSLTSEFIDALSKNDFIDNLIIGVENNE